MKQRQPGSKGGGAPRPDSEPPFKVWLPDEDGQDWVEDDEWDPIPLFDDGEDALLTDDRRESRRGKGYLVVWSEDTGYRALARDADDLPEPLEILHEEVEEFREGDLELHPTLLGGTPQHDYEREDEGEAAESEDEGEDEDEEGDEDLDEGY